MMMESLTTTRDLGRVYDLATILIRYGFGDMVSRMRLEGVLQRAGKVLPLEQLAELAALPAPVRVRRALEEMGPSFVKLGQVLATRVDLFEPQWIAEFGRLQSHAPVVPFAAIHAQMLEDLGASPEAVFQWLDPEPLAAASIAQVHRARLRDGTDVVVKVRRPGIRPVIEADMRLLQRAAQVIETQFPELQRFHPAAVVEQFRRSLTRELDLAAECRNAERIAASLGGRDDVVVPAVYWDYTSERMNVQEYIDGLAVLDLPALDSAGVDRQRVARTGARVILKMMLEDGFFHADPHPGNVFVLPGDRIAVIDFGMVGRLSQARRAQVVSLLFGLVERDAERVTEVLLDWTEQPPNDEARLAEDLDAFVDRYHGVPLGQLDLAAMLLEVTALLREHALALPSDLAMLIKVCITLEGMGRSLDPSFDMARQAAPFLRRAMRARYRPDVLAKGSLRMLVETAEVLSDLPHELRRLLRSVRTDNLKLHIHVRHLEEFSHQVDHSANRLTMGVVVAALIVGSSIAMTAQGGPKLLGLPSFALIGFIGAALAGVWLVFSIWRSGGGR